MFVWIRRLEVCCTALSTIVLLPGFDGGFRETRLSSYGCSNTAAVYFEYEKFRGFRGGSLMLENFDLEFFMNHCGLSTPNVSSKIFT